MATPAEAEGTAAKKRVLECAGESQVEGPRKKKAAYRPQSRKKKAGFDEEISSETSYSIKNGLRYVKPYYFTFTTHAKGRWVGSTVYDVFCREFQAESPEYYEKAIKDGKVTVNSKLATMDTVINHNDLVCHRIHRHEPPVTAEPLKIVHQDDSIVVLNKPASIPVHPCGRYRHNSVVFLLGKEHNLRNLHTVHRLDRLTSGLLMFARTVGSAQQMEEAIRGRRVAKVYLCRVYGEFPCDPVECSEPILVVSHKLGVCRVDPGGKLSATLFTRLSYNGKTSLLRCSPKTGRMHQIRVHLQWLGHPIVNDPLYNHPAWGPQRAKQGKGVAEMTKVITEIVKTNYSYGTEDSREPLAVKSAAVLPHLAVKPSTGTTDLTSVNTTATHGLQQPERTCRDMRERDSERSEDSERDGSQRDSRAGSPTAVNHCNHENTPARTKASGSEIPAVTGELPTVTLATETSLVTSAEASNSRTEQTPLVRNVIEGGVESGRSLASEFPWQPPEVAADTDPDCTECGLVRADPTPQELVMYLHALSYKGEGWEFATEEPEWASPDWQE